MRDTIFVGRAKEIALIEEMVADSTGGKYLLPLIGAPGVGKTWLFQELYRRHHNNPTVLVVRLDYRESRTQSLPGLSLHAIEQFAPYMTTEQTADFHRHMHDWHRLVETEIDPERIRAEQQKIYHFGIDLVWQLSQTYRILFLSDSLDAEHALEDIQRTNLLAANVPNTVMVLAGRPTQFTHNVYEELAGLYKRWQTHPLYELPPFSIDEVRAYVDACGISGKGSSESSGDAAKELGESLMFFTQGHPVLVSIASEWLHHHTLPEELSFTTKKLASFVEARQEELRQHFERMVVADIAKQNSLLDKALLALSFLNRRYNPELLNLVQEVPNEDERTALLDALHSHVFVRTSMLTSGGLLHDEAQRLLQTYVWNEVDPDNTLRQNMARTVIDGYYLPHIERLTTIIQEKLTRSLKPTLVKVDHRDILPIPDEYWPKRDLQLECLYYYFCISETAGWQYLNQLFDDALTHHYSLIQMDAIVQAVYRLAPQQVNSAMFQVRVAQILLEKGEVQRAATMAETALESSDIEPADASKACIVLADATTDPAEKVTHFKVALEMAEAAEDPVLELKVLNRLGLAYRRQGHWKEAEHAYLQVLQKMSEEEEPNQYAATLNNLSFVYMLNGNPIRADNLAEKALRIRREQGNIHGLGFSYSTRGRIAEAMGDYLLALRYHRTAVDLCELVGDSNNAALMQVNVAACECYAQRFETAHLLLSRALRSDLPHIRARALQQASRIDVEEALSLNSQGAAPAEVSAKYDSAEKAARHALELAREVLDDHLVASVLIDLLFIIFYKEQRKDDESLHALYGMLKDHHYILEKGRLIELEGHIAFEQGNRYEAFMKYLDACDMLANYSPANFRQTLERMRDKFLDMPYDMQQRICQNIHERYPTVAPGSPLVAVNDLCIPEIIGFKRG